MAKKDKATILIVDDKPANLIALETLLETPDRILINANNGKDALKITLNRDIDLIILDVQMPDMDGFEVAQILKSNNRTKDIPIIFASAERTERRFMMKGYEEGGMDYLFKPLDPEVAKAKVSVLLQLQLQKKELQEKNNSLEKSALLINNSADIIGIIDAKTFKIEEINQAFSSILGYTLTEAKETSLVFFLSDEDRRMVQLLKKKEKERLSFETRIYCKDRSIKWLQWNVVVKYEKWFVNARDITEIKEVEKIRNYLATVVKQSGDAIYIHDTEGKIMAWNEGAEDIYGYLEKEAIKMNVGNIIPEFDQVQTEELRRRLFAGEKLQDIEAKRITKHGKLIDVLFSASTILDAASEKSVISITERDITGQKIADEKIKQLNSDLQGNIVKLQSVNKELESFSYSVSHDLRAPLRAINGYAKIIEEDYGLSLDEEAKRLFAGIKSNSDRMNILIEDLLKLSRLGKKTVEKSEVNMNEMVERVLTEISRSAGHKASVISHVLEPAFGDPSLLNQVWTNLLSNAIKYSSKKERPEIEIGCTKQEDEIVYYVKDNGAGFSMDYAEKLFNVFQRLHSSNDFEGTGVGLAIVHRIISKHGGRIWAEAKVNEGAVFYFTLPGL
jgi:PAS domain S-box-containing protein